MRTIAYVLLSLLFASPALAQSKAQERIKIIHEFVSAHGTTTEGKGMCYTHVSPTDRIFVCVTGPKDLEFHVLATILVEKRPRVCTVTFELTLESDSIPVRTPCYKEANLRPTLEYWRATKGGLAFLMQEHAIYRWAIASLAY